MRSASMSRQSYETLQVQTQTPPQGNHTNNMPSRLYRSYTNLVTKLHNILGWAKKAKKPIVDPDSIWIQLFDTSFIVALFIDPLFFFLLSVEKTNKCMVLNRSVGIVIAVVRSITDFFHLLHMFVQIKPPSVAPDWTAGSGGLSFQKENSNRSGGQLVKEHGKIALHYLRVIFDLFLVLPLPQVLNLVVIPKYIRPSAENYSKYMLPTIILLQVLQYIPRTLRFLPMPLLPGRQSARWLMSESAWTNYVVNILMFVLAGHAIGSAWYLFGFQRVRQCLLHTCGSFNKTLCSSLIVCGTGGDIDNFSQQFRQQWRDYDNSSNCLNSTSDQFSYGIYQLVVPLTTKDSVITRYIYSLFWGFQQISTLAGNQTPSYFVWEVLFTMAIVGIGLQLFALLIGNVQNILQAPEKRRLEMQQKKHDMEQWMRNIRLPDHLREEVRKAERLSWRTTCGLNEEKLLLNLPDKLQKEIRRGLYSRLLKKVGILTSLDDQIFDAITDKLRRKMYPRESCLVVDGDHIDKVVFIMSGTLECKHRSGDISSLKDGEVFGEELIAWYLGHYKVGGKNRYQELRLISEKTLRCLTDVEVLVLRADDIDQAISVSGVLCNPNCS